MSSTIAGSDTWQSLITIPSDGDTITAAHANAPVSGLADRTRFLYERWFRTQMLPMHNMDSTYETGWSLGDGTFTGAAGQTAARKIHVFIPLRSGEKLTVVGVNRKSLSAHGGAPANPFNIALYRVAATLGSFGLVGNTVDTYVSAATYDANHAVEITGMTETDATTYWYRLDITNEWGPGGTNCLGTDIFSVYATYRLA